MDLVVVGVVVVGAGVVVAVVLRVVVLIFVVFAVDSRHACCFGRRRGPSGLPLSPKTFPLLPSGTHPIPSSPCDGPIRLDLEGEGAARPESPAAIVAR